MSLSTDGPLLIALNRAKAMLAATAVWNEISTAQKIHFDALPPASPGPDYTLEQIVQLRPLAILWHEVSGGFRLAVATADACFPDSSGRIVIQVEVNTPAEMVNNPNALGEYMNRLMGRLVHTGHQDSPGLWELSNRAGYLPLRELHASPYVRTAKKEINSCGDACGFELVLDWGHVR